ncbi:sulfite exporter TauE/SafE family protein [Deinococcus sp.]|uniref:sulfite exporter TauE/SafE family protein n=1 Tax=Deinococcus sp. TaxID=47478 RepID=UPI003CC5FC7E
MHLAAWQWLLAAFSALLIGFSKTGLPGAGIVAVPLLASAFGARLSVGTALPLLLVGDLCALASYRAHADWGQLRRLLPWVALGLLSGTLALWVLGSLHLTSDPLGPLIGGLILGMLALNVLRPHLGERLQPYSPVGTALTGVLAGCTTMISNAGGPIMSIFMVAAGLPKQQMMGTSAWNFFIFNLAKGPLLLLLTLLTPGQPLFTAASLRLSLQLGPLVLLGAWLGRWLLPQLPERLFSALVLLLAGAAALKLLL